MAEEPNGDRIRRMQIIRGCFLIGCFVSILLFGGLFIWIDREWEPEEMTLIQSVASALIALLGVAAGYYFANDDK